LAEWDYGDYEGLTPSEIGSIQPGWNVFDDGCPGGEAPADVERRADTVIADVRTLDVDVGLFTHGHIGRVIAARWLGLEVRGAGLFLLDTASFGILSFAHNNRDEPVMESWNIGHVSSADQSMEAPAKQQRLGQNPVP
jgi:probable phosphoglycerate mutase